MSQTVTMIGLHAEEIRWMQLLVSLLRHPDATVGELARQALVYISESSAARQSEPAVPIGQNSRSLS